MGSRSIVLHLAAILVCGNCLTGTLLAQQKKVTFTSVYTSLSSGCKTIGDNDPHGTDPAFDCPGVKPYRIFISNAAAAASLAVEKRGQDAQVTGIMSECANYGTRAEWRLANGKPFAVIIRIAKYPDDNMNSEQPCSEKLGTVLRVVGFEGVDLDASIDGAEPNANAKARAAADEAYAKRP